MPYRVGIIAVPTSPAVIRRLAERMHLWVMDSPGHRAAVETLWERRPIPELERGATLFSAPPRLETREDWLSLLEVIELHHGEYSHQPPVDELEVIGTRASDEVRHALSEYGFLELTSSDEGFVARKPTSGY